MLIKQGMQESEYIYGDVDGVGPIYMREDLVSWP